MPRQVTYLSIVYVTGSRGDLQPGAPARVQARDQAGAVPQAHRGVRRHPQGGLLQVEEEPQEGAEARHQEVVLRAQQAVRPPRRVISYEPKNCDDAYEDQV